MSEVGGPSSQVIPKVPGQPTDDHQPTLVPTPSPIPIPPMPKKMPKNTFSETKWALGVVQLRLFEARLPDTEFMRRMEETHGDIFASHQDEKASAPKMSPLPSFYAFTYSQSDAESILGHQG